MRWSLRGQPWRLPVGGVMEDAKRRWNGSNALGSGSPCFRRSLGEKVPLFFFGYWFCRWFRWPCVQGRRSRRRSTRSCGMPARGRWCRCRRRAASSSTSPKATASRWSPLSLSSPVLASAVIHGSLVAPFFCDIFLWVFPCGRTGYVQVQWLF